MTTTTAKQMREKRAKGIEFVLPEYGDTVFIRPMDAAFFFKTGKVPDYLSATVNKMLIDGGSISEAKELTPEKVSEWITWLDDLIKWAVVSPKVVDVPQADDEIGIDELGYSDKLAVYRWFGQPAQALIRFREQQVKSVAPVDAAKDHEPKAKRGAERPAVGE